MKYLFKITNDSVKTLLNGVDFELRGKLIILLEENCKILRYNLNEILINFNQGFVIFTDDVNRIDECKCKLNKKERGN